MAASLFNMLDKFTEIMNAPPFHGIGGVSDFAVAVSGGPDSMALARLLCLWSENVDGPNVHVLTVDHGLRPEASQEAQMVAKALKSWPKVSHQTLIWHGVKPDTRLQEEARTARYDLMSEYCAERSIDHLFLAHHGDDQMETFLFRLSKGSGLDGLCGMRPMQERGNLILCRPLLSFSKAELLEYCEDETLFYCDDPSNDKNEFSRVRIRKMIAALEEEGFSFKRLNKTAERLSRARDYLASKADQVYSSSATVNNTNRIEFLCDDLREHGFEVTLRVLKLAADDLVPVDGYGPRTEKLEALVDDFLKSKPFRKRTLGGIIFEIFGEDEYLVLQKENC